ncbi:ABC transporter permease, partial [Candidatus Saccharibacteria bacterium]|nr:ABC transporter permease [Candidatus Saccharibacteria bacterium]
RIDTFMMILAKLGLIQLAFLALGFLLSVLLKKVKSAIAVSLPVVFSFFIVGTIAAVLGIDEIKYVSPFKFFNSDYIISHNAYEVQFLILELVFVVVAVIASYTIYIKKDIRAAA